MKSVPVGWEKHLSAWSAYMLSEGKSKCTISMRIRWLRRFARSVDKRPQLVTKKDILAWSAAGEWEQETRRGAHASVRKFFEWEVKAGQIKRSPAADLAVIPQSEPRPHPQNQAVINAAIVKAKPHVGLMIKLAYRLGLRRGEVARIHQDDISLDLLGYSLKVHGKGGKIRYLPLPDDLAAEIQSYGVGYLFPGADNGHLSPEWVGKLVSDALPRGVHMHNLRHTLATRAYDQTKDLIAVQAILGHKSPETTLRYIGVSQSRLREVILKAS